MVSSSGKHLKVLTTTYLEGGEGRDGSKRSFPKAVNKERLASHPAAKIYALLTLLTLVIDWWATEPVSQKKLLT